MPKLYFAKGSNLNDFFFIPTIRLHAIDYAYGYLTIEWFKWYIGIKW